MNRLAVCAVLAAAVAAAPAAVAQDLLIVNGNLIDPAAREVRQGSLLIRDGRIAGLVDEAPADFDGDVVDAEGGWIVPGLNDLHTHSYGNMGPGGAFESAGTATVAKRYLYCGVTGFLDLFGDEETLYTLRATQRENGAAGADLFASLSCLTATKGHCTEYGVATRTMDSPEEARRVVADLASRRPDVVKIVYAPTGRMASIDKATLAAAVATAGEHGIKTVIHVNTWDDVADAVEVGASAVTHVPTEGPVPPELARAMAEAGVAHIPTLAVQTDFAYFVNDPEVLADPLAQRVAPASLLASYRAEETVRMAASHRARHAEGEKLILASVKTLADAGVVMLTGTDSGNWGTIQGYSIHRELEKLVAAGLTPWQALAASTTAAGAFLGRSWGVSPGDEANLVILDASPLEAIGNTRAIRHVVHHGRLVDRESLLEPPAS